MSKTTGPILAVGAITMANRSLLHDEPLDWRIPIGTGIAAMGFALAEKAWEPAAVALAWMALISVLLSRIDPAVPSPVETIDDWYRRKVKWTL